MRHFICLAIVLLSGCFLRAEPEGELIFSDDFERDEVSSDKEEPGKGWTTNSAWRAPCKKQVDLKDGALHGGTDPTAGHALVLFHPAGLRDGAVALKFKIGAKESLGIEFADPACKSVHAGHLAMIKVSPTQLSITDLKTGNMDLKIQARRKAGEKSPELNALLKTKTTVFPVDLEPDEWHTLYFSARGDTLTASVDGHEVGAFSSEGIDHPVKHEIRINIGKTASIDEVKIWKFQ